jgi:hypothetical protein
MGATITFSIQSKRRCYLCILQQRNFPKQLHKAITKIYENNEMKIKLHATLTQPTKINIDTRQVCTISLTLFSTYINQIIIEWKYEKTRGIKIQ